MEKWVEHDGNDIDGDVLRWNQAIWSDEGPRRSKKKKVTKLGERRLTAEYLGLDSKGCVRLSVLKDEILSNVYEIPLKVLKKGTVIVRKRTTISKGKPERLLWTDETARSWATATSRFLR